MMLKINLPNNLVEQVYTNLFHSAAAFLILLACYVLVLKITKKRQESNKARRRLRLRLFYIFSFIFIIILTRLWVSGFTHILTVLGLVSAALVVTNKETIMNLTGWFIIQWRDLFTEDDYIEIEEYKGYVRRIGLLYFTLSEMSSVTDNHVSGRNIKVPNGLVVNHVVTNHSHQSFLFKVRLSAIFAPNSNIDLAKKIMLSCVETVLSTYCKDHHEYSEEFILKKHRDLKDLSYLKPALLVKAKFDKPSGIAISVDFFSYAKDQEILENLIWDSLLHHIDQKSELRLSFDGYN